MGRRKIQIAPIMDDRNRNVTFGKRRNGLFKKAYELGVLCQVDIAVMVWSHTGKLHVFSSAGGLKPIMERYADHGSGNIDVTTPKSYGDSAPCGLQPLPSNDHPPSAANAVKQPSKPNKKRRRSESDDDDDDDDDGDDNDEYGAGSSMVKHDAANNPYGGGSAYHSSISPPEHQQAGQNPIPPMPAPGHPGSLYPGYAHPLYGNYAYPGYPGGMPNVNPALGNAFSQFFQPSHQAAAYAAQAMSAAAAANGQSAYPTPSAYMPMYSQPPRYGSQPAPGGAGDYGQMRTSPAPMDESQQQGSSNNGATRSAGNAANRQGSMDSYRSNANHPGGDNSRKPSLQITMPEQSSVPPESNLREKPESQNATENGEGRSESRQGQRAADSDRRGSYNPQSHGDAPQQQQQQHLMPPDFANMPFPDAYITSPSTLFPEIYRNFQMQAMGDFSGQSPAVQDDEENKVFKWPSLGNGVKEEDKEQKPVEENQAGES